MGRCGEAQTPAEVGIGGAGRVRTFPLIFKSTVELIQVFGLAQVINVVGGFSYVVISLSPGFGFE